jgi:hypothetical protein
MSALIVGAAAIWGLTPETGDTYAAGIIVTQSNKSGADKDFVLDGQGFAIGAAYFNNKNECSIEVVCESGTTPPEPGDEISIAGIDCLVDDSEVKWNQKGWKMLSIKATKFANLTP